MIWSKLWMDLFGRTSLFGIDMGFWVAMSTVLLIVIVYDQSRFQLSGMTELL